MEERGGCVGVGIKRGMVEVSKGLYPYVTKLVKILLNLLWEQNRSS